MAGYEPESMQVGAGTAALDIMYRLREHVLLRGEFLDYLTTFPRQIVPIPHNTARGVFEQFTPLFGVSYSF